MFLCSLVPKGNSDACSVSLWSSSHSRLASAGPRRAAGDPDKPRPVGDCHCIFHNSIGIFLRHFHIWNFKESLPFNKMVVNLRKHCAFFVLINFSPKPLTNYWLFPPFFTLNGNNGQREELWNALLYITLLIFLFIF